jgi:hypothetical protein
MLLAWTPHLSAPGPGIDFLVAKQQPDGSWPKISRSTPNGSPGSAADKSPSSPATSPSILGRFIAERTGVLPTFVGLIYL